MSDSTTTVIRDAAWIAAWDGHGQRYLRNGDVAFSGDRIVQVGGRYKGPADRSIDGAPHNLVEEMRLAIVLARVMAGSIRVVDTGEMFRAATVGGAAALGRDDFGRLAPGAKADIVLLDLDHPAMRPARDPLRTFVFEAADRAVREVFVDGRAVVTDGKPLHLDPERAGARLEESQARMLADAPRHDFLGRSGDAIAPYSLPL